MKKIYKMEYKKFREGEIEDEIIKLDDRYYIEKTAIAYTYTIDTLVYFLSDNEGNEWGQFPTFGAAKATYNKLRSQ